MINRRFAVGDRRNPSGVGAVRTFEKDLERGAYKKVGHESGQRAGSAVPIG